MLWLPEAEKRVHKNIGNLSFREKDDPKGVLHTTETFGVPSYSDWSIPPHVTVQPFEGLGVKVFQHIPFDRAAFALRNLPGGVETNRDYAFQIELVGTCDPARTRKDAGIYYWPNADDKVLEALGRDVILPMHEELGIPLRSPQWRSYPESYGRSEVRMGGYQWDEYAGFLGHQHVPENSHGDPGLFPWQRMMRLLDRVPKPAPVAPPFPLRKGEFFGFGGVRSGHGLLNFQRRMYNRGWTTINRNDKFTERTDVIVREFQDEKNLTVDGKVGPKTWKAAWILPVT